MKALRFHAAKGPHMDGIGAIPAPALKAVTKRIRPDQAAAEGSSVLPDPAGARLAAPIDLT